MQLNLSQIMSLATTMNQGRMDYSTSELSLAANLACAEVSTRLPHRYLEGIATSSTTSGERRMDLPTDFDYALTVSITSGAGWRKPLQERQVAWLDSLGTQLGEPNYYVQYSSWLELAPSPNSAYSLEMRYTAKVSSLVSSVDTPNLAERYHYAVALKTAEIAAALRNDIDQEAVCRARYLSYMGSTPSDMAYQQRAQEGVSVALQKARR